MTARLPVINGRQALRTLIQAGFVLDRVVGSHHILAHPTDHTRTVVVPVHAGRDLKPGTIRSIIRQSGLSVEEFCDLL